MFCLYGVQNIKASDDDSDDGDDWGDYDGCT